MATIDIPQSLENLKLERDAIALYDALAGIEKDPRRAEAFRTIAGNERRHANVWAGKLRDLGATVPEPDGPRLRVRTILLVARLFGTHAVRDMVQALEGDEEDTYNAQATPRGRGDRGRTSVSTPRSGSASAVPMGSPSRPDTQPTARATSPPGSAGITQVARERFGR
jgi:hypothetical protein